MQVWLVQLLDKYGEGYTLLGVGQSYDDANSIREAFFNGGMDRQYRRVTIHECSTGYLWDSTVE